MDRTAADTLPLDSSSRRSLARQAMALLLCWAQTIPVWAAPAQLPLLTRSENPAKPNLMYTFDDSGSMSYGFMPDKMGTWFNASDNITLARRIFFHPSDDTVNNTSTPYIMTTRANDLWSARLRSSSWNTIYYNPDIRYQPWYKSDGSLFPEYPPNASPLEPMNPTGTKVDLSSSTNYGTSVNFCRSTSNASINRTNNDTSTPTCGPLNASGETIWHATYYDYNPSTGVYTRKRIASTDITYPVTRSATRTDCVPAGSCSQAKELQNFANWFTYYRTRNKLAIAASTRAFATVEDGTFRLGYGRINKTDSTLIDNVSTKTIQRGVRTYSGTDKDSFFTWLHNMPAQSGTPLRRAMDDVGKYYQRTDNRGPWGNTPGTDDGIALTSQLQCRKSYHILMTDGFWNGDAASTSGATANVDNTNGSVINGPNGQSYQYIKTRPYLDSYSNTLADVAMYYWNRDLRPDLENRVKPDASNPAFWQHMVNFTVSLGLTGTLTYPTDLAGIQSGSKNWPPVGDDLPANLDDLWHAAVNSRGDYLSAKDPDEFASSLSSILNEISVRNASEGGVAATAATLQAGNRKYVPEYKTAIWTGNLTAYELDQFGQQLSPVWNAEKALTDLIGINGASHAARNILVGTRNGTTKAEPFTWSGMSAALKADLPGASETLVNYLRGDASFEAGLYRERSARLGDFVNSQPVYVKSLVDMQYNFLPEGTAGRTTYKGFLSSKASREGVVFIGGNDGMLHAFRDSDGREIFGFIPRILLQYLPALSSSSYEHRYYVDGQLTESDAYLGGWKNVLLGSTGAGARAVFALDVTNSSAMGAGNVMWEMDSTLQSELGYVMAPIEVGLLKNGQWAAVFGNGPDSSSGTAQLFIVNLQTGALISRIQASAATGNGLGGVRLIRDANRVVVGAYAGDLKGNVWKFDLSATTSGSWGVSFGGTPLYQAGSNKPITAPPQYVVHPLGGYMVLIGTGKLYEEGDQSSTAQQALYGLWDKQQLVANATTGAAEWSTILASDAQVQTSTLVNHSFNASSVSGAEGATYYKLTTQPLNWNIHRGWTLPLTIVTGHRNLLSPTFLFGYVLFETMSPTTGGVANPCEDSGAGGAYNLLINPVDGSAPKAALFDVNGDGYVNSSDAVVAGYKGTWDGRDVVLSQKPCIEATDCPQDPENRCASGTKLQSIQSAVGGNVNLCPILPPRERWWWRQLQQIPE